MIDENTTYIQNPAPERQDPKILDEINQNRAFDAEQLAKVIGYWMNYQQGVTRSLNLLHEASFRYPIAEFLERNLKTAAVLELEHPVFRKPMDFQWKIEGRRYFLECKYAKEKYTETKQEMQRYFNDICRLYYCIENPENDECYFLVCGKTHDFNHCFRLSDDLKQGRKDPVNKRRFNNFLTFDDKSPKELEIHKVRENIDDSINNCYCDFENEYKGEDEEPNIIENDITLTVKLINIWDEDKQTIALWQILKGKLSELDGKIVN